MSGTASSDDGITRRGLFRRGATAAAGTAAIVGGGSRIAPRYSPIGRADALACGGVCIAGGAAAAGVAVGWAGREYEVLGKDDPPTGVTADALHESTWQTALARDSNIESTFVDNRNIVNNLDYAAYAEGKIDAIESLNAGDSESAVTDAALAGAQAYFTTVISNLLKSWNEAARELEAQFSAVESHSDLTTDAVFTGPNDWATWATDGLYLSKVTYDLPDGTQMDVEKINLDYETSGGAGAIPDWTPMTSSTSGLEITVESPNSDSVTYMVYSAWNGLLSDMESVLSDVEAGLNTWVTNIYDQVQSGDLDTADLLTPRELAAMSSEDDGVDQAIADLMALNISADLENEVTISIDKTDYKTQISGMLTATSESVTLEAGTTYDPAADFSGDVYMTYNSGDASGEWYAYDDTKGVDGGEVDLTAEPFDGMVYEIHTTESESATVSYSDWTAYDSSDNELADIDDPDAAYWRTNIGDQLDNSVVDIDRIDIAAPDDQTENLTVLIDDPFTVESIQNSETGEESTSVNFSREQPHDDTNYITQEEWDAQLERQQKLIEKYESETGGASGGSSSSNDLLLIGGFGALIVSTLGAMLLQDDQ